MDAVACEPQFVDHAAALWRSLPSDLRGRFRTPFVDRAARLGVEAEALDVNEIKANEPLPPKARPWADGPTAFVVSIGDIKLGRRLGYRRFVFMEHGAGQAYLGDRGAIRHASYAGGIDRDDVSLFLMPNEYSAALWRQAYPRAQVEVVGCPRLDDLPSRVEGPGPVVAISFHWPAHSVVQEAGTVMGHYLGILPELAKAYPTLGHAHPKGDWQTRMFTQYAAAGIETVTDFDDVCRRADVYICDNSSTLFEFAATGRPVVVLNGPMYRKAIHHGLRFWDAADVGVQVDKPADLVEAVRLAIEDAPARRQAREAALDKVYAYRSGAAARASDVIADHLGAAVAA